MKKINTNPGDNVSYQEKLDYCLKTLKESFRVSETNDEFTKEHSMLVKPSLAQIWSNDDFVDQGFDDLNDGLVQCLKQQFYEANEASVKELRDSGVSNEYIEESIKSDLSARLEYVLENKRLELTTKSTVKAVIGYYVDSADNTSTYTFDLDFTNYSHHRNLSSLKVYFKKDNGDVMCLDNEVSVVQQENETFHFLIDNALMFISREQVDFIVEATSLSVRFENVEARCHSYLMPDDIQELDFIVGKDRSETTTGILYNRLKEEEEKKKIAEEKEKLAAQKDEYEKAFAALDFNDLGLLKKLLADPLSIKQYKNLVEFCAANKRKSSTVTFVESIPSKFDIGKIENELQEHEKRANKAPKAVNGAFFWFALITFIIHSVANIFYWGYTVGECVLPTIMWAANCIIPYMVAKSNLGLVSENKSNIIIGTSVIVHAVCFFLYIGEYDFSFGYWGTYIYLVAGSVISSILSERYKKDIVGPMMQELLDQLAKHVGNKKK